MLPDIGAAPLPEAKAKMEGHGMTQESLAWTGWRTDHHLPSTGGLVLRSRRIVSSSFALEARPDAEFLNRFLKSLNLFMGTTILVGTVFGMHPVPVR